MENRFETSQENLLRDLEHEIWEFQSESEEEDQVIITGLLDIIERIKENGKGLRPKDWEEDY